MYTGKNILDDCFENFNALAIFLDKKDVSSIKIRDVVVSSNTKKNHWKLGHPVYYFSGHIDGIHTRKIRIQNEEVDPNAAVNKLQQILSVFDQPDIVSAIRQLSPEKTPDVRISIGDENFTNLFHCLSSIQAAKDAPGGNWVMSRVNSNSPD